MSREIVVTILRSSKATDTNCLEKMVLDYQEQNLIQMEQQLIAAENFELVSPEKLQQWRLLFHKQQQSILANKEKLSR